MKKKKRKSKIEKFYLKNKVFILYTLVSFFCTGILYSVYYSINLITDGNYFIANLIAYTLSFTILYLLDKEVFKSKPTRKKKRIEQLTMFILFRIIGFIFDSLLLMILIEKFHIDNMVSKIISSLVTFIFNYITNKLFVYKNKLI